MYHDHSDKLQKFEDRRFGCTATLRIEQDKDKPFVLRVREPFGSLFFRKGYDTAHEAKLALEKVIIQGSTLTGSWWTVSGCVCDIQ